jgi:hypothetical protein
MLTDKAKTPSIRAIGVGNFPENGQKWECPETASDDEAEADVSMPAKYVN